MSRKRTLLPDIYKQKKKACLGPNPRTNGFTGNDEEDLKSSSNETKTTLLYMCSLFPVEKFEHRLPPIVLKHQLYSLLKNRSTVDKQLNDMEQSGEIKMFELGTDTDGTLLVFTDHYRNHVQCVMAELNIAKEITDKYVATVINKCRSGCVDRDQLLNEYAFTDLEIKQLTKSSLLTVRDTDSWRVTVPNSAIFMKSYARGRKTVITMIKKCKYREVLRNELEQRKWPKLAKLGLLYHIHDIIGADLVDCIQTTSGQLLRLKD